MFGTRNGCSTPSLRVDAWSGRHVVGGGQAGGAPASGPAGTSFVPLPVPIASTLPPPSIIEPLAGTSNEDREQLIVAAQERRRELVESGQVLNRVVYDALVFVPGSADRVPGGALLFESRFESGNLRRAVHVNGTSTTCC